jgi:hypothetical protein
LLTIRTELKAIAHNLDDESDGRRKQILQLLVGPQYAKQPAEQIVKALALLELPRQRTQEKLEEIRKVREESKRLWHKFEQGLEKRLVRSDTEQARES